jgi:hypothetical protein
MSMTRIGLVSLVFLLGCPKNTPYTYEDTSNVTTYEDLKCEEGTRPVGTPPPSGTRVWCVRKMPTGAEVRHGPSFAWHSNGEMASTGSWVDDRQHGHWTFWASQSFLESEGAFVEGEEEGIWKFYYADGSIKAEGPMSDGGRHGQWSYVDENGIQNEGTWAYGEREGRWYDKDPEGRVVRERIYRAGRLIEQKEYAVKD